MKETAQYERWCKLALEDPDLVEELRRIQGQEEEIYERFFQELSFGTAGLRGVLGAGTNRMNIYTVRQATQGFANDLNRQYEHPSVAIAYDSRIKSDLFAREAASVFAANGITAYLYPHLMPTPALSFAVRHLGCQGGVVVTASHNPSKYNGYKAYGPDGCQINLETADRIHAEIVATDLFEDVRRLPYEEGLQMGSIRLIGQEVEDAYLAAVLAEQRRPGVVKGSGLKVVYTPLNGAGRTCVTRALQAIGLEQLTLVASQAEPDGTFPTCPYPNPEDAAALQEGLAVCRREDADLLIATDPDSDRVGIAVRDGADYRLVTGNETGVLLLDYICRARLESGEMPQNPLTVKTIVTSTMVDEVARSYGVEVVNTLTGFKFIGEQILHLEEKGEKERYIFGFEESYGYLSGTYVRDKDGVDASMLICEMAAYYRRQGMTLADALRALYEKYGTYVDHVDNLYFEGVDGMERMAALMDRLRQSPITEICGAAVTEFYDYQNRVMTRRDGSSQALTLPRSNVLIHRLENGCTVIARPSGTEPKLKIYFTIVGRTRKEAAGRLEEYRAFMKERLA